MRTKLYQPTIQQPVVERMHLIEKMSVGLLAQDVFSRKLTLVSSSAGFGKTTLVCQWLDHLSLPTAWLSLDEQDNNPVRFFSYLIAALQSISELAQAHVGEASFAMLHAPELPQLSDVLTNLVNDSTAVSAPAILVIDDYHLIQAAAVHQGLTFLLDNLPSHWHLVLISRADPPMPLPKLRASRQLLEMRESELKFTEVETAVFLEQSLDIDLSPADIATLGNRTEGWVVGLQMAALSLQGHSDPEAFIQTFSGSHRFVLDYLMAEVLQQQPEYVQEFLLQTAVLNRMSAPLCDAVIMAGKASEDDDLPESSQPILEYLERTNLFIIPLDDQRQWYRYHHLFVDLLRARLYQTKPKSLSAYHLRASAWFEANGYVDEAVSHAFASGDLNEAAYLIIRHGMIKMFQGEMSTLFSWIGQLPEAVIKAHTWLCILDGWLKLFMGELTAVSSRLDQAEAVLSPEPDKDLLGNLATLKAYHSSILRQPEKAMAYARQALACLDPDDGSMRSVVIYTQAISYVLGDDVESAIVAYGETGRLGGASGNIHMAVPSFGSKSGMEIIMGNLRQAAKTVSDALPLARLESGRDSPIAARLYSPLSQLAYEHDDLITAEKYAETAIILSRQWGNADVLTRNPVLMARVRIAQGDFTAAAEFLDTSDQFIKKFGREALSPGLLPHVDAGRIHWWLAQNQVERAMHWAERENMAAILKSPLGLMEELSGINFAQIKIWAGQTGQAQDLLTELLTRVHAGHRVGREIQIRALLALIEEEKTAVSHLVTSLKLAEPENYRRTFLDLMPRIEKPLRLVVAAHPRWAYPAALLTAVSPKAPVAVENWQTKDGYLVEPLSEREIEVLRLIADGYSNRDISEKLIITVGTVKSHANHIFSKMGVKNRTQAVAKARELNLI